MATRPNVFSAVWIQEWRRILVKMGSRESYVKFYNNTGLRDIRPRSDGSRAPRPLRNRYTAPLPVHALRFPQITHSWLGSLQCEVSGALPPMPRRLRTTRAYDGQTRTGAIKVRLDCLAVGRSWPDNNYTFLTDG